MFSKQQEFHNRGALISPANRFEQISFTLDEDCPPEDQPNPKTLFFKDTSKSIISYNDSPDIGFDASLNPYRGCEHGCVIVMPGPPMSISVYHQGLILKAKFLSRPRPRLCYARN